MNHATFETLDNMHRLAERRAHYMGQPHVLVERVYSECDERETYTVSDTFTVYIPQFGMAACGTDYAGACAALEEHGCTREEASWQHEILQF